MADYITLADLVDTMSLGSETFADADLSAAITAASREVDRRCDRSFAPVASGVRYYTPEHSRVAWVDDIVSVQEVAVDSVGDGSFAQVWTQNTDFVLGPLNAAADGLPYTTITIPRLSTKYFWQWERSLRVSGSFGWPAIPAAVVQATTLLASRFVKRAREAPFGVAGFGIDGGSMYVSKFDPDVDALLAGLVRVNHAF